MSVEHYIRIVRTRGVADLLGYSRGTAEVVKPEEIHSVHILTQGKVPIQSHPYIPEGTPVRVLAGPLKGVVGIVKEHRGKRRIVVQVDLLRQAVSCELNVEEVESI